MLAALGLLTILAVLAGILSKRVSPMIALIAFPVIGCALAGEAGDLGSYISDGIRTVAPMAGPLPVSRSVPFCLQALSTWMAPGHRHS